MDQARVKGVGMMAAVAAFRGERETMLEIAPDSLKRYLEERISEYEWYPYEDLIGLLRLTARVNLPFLAEEEAFRFFGAVSAQRDLAGSQEKIIRELRVERVGSYKGAVTKQHSLAEIMRRGFGMFQIYHEQGEFKLSRPSSRVVRAELMDFPFLIPQVCQISTGFAEELNRMTSCPGKTVMVSCRCLGDACCAWEVTFPEDADVSSLDELGPVTPASSPGPPGHAG